MPVALDKPERDLLLSYAYNGMFNIRHALLLRLQFKSSATTVHGHSGSALASSSSGGRLLGMHLYLDDSSNTALAIPAALVFDPRRYMGGGPSEQRSLLTRASHELMPYFATPATTAAPASAVQSLPTTLPHAVVPFWVEALLDQHAMYDGITWQLAPDGVRIGSAAALGTAGAPDIVCRVWHDYGDSIKHWCTHLEIDALTPRQLPT